ncbi:MAG TPA: DUF998 domain-containing protein [Ktedonobacterales bacterium]
MQAPTTRPASPLIAAGGLAGPFFMLLATIQVLTRPGFQPLRCQVSQLAIGDAGWVQALNFLVTGALVLAFGLGLRQALRPQRLLPALVGCMGLGFLAATCFATVPGYGCPSGPVSVPPGVTINGPAHDLAAGAVFISFLVAGLFCARRAWRQRQYGFARYSLGSVVAMLAFLTLSSLGYAQTHGLTAVSGLFEWLALLSVFAWITTVAVALVSGRRWAEGPNGT